MRIKMARTFEDVRTLLAEKISKEKKRLKSYKTKANSFDLANAIARYVQSLMAESRHRELTRVMKKGFKTKKEGWKPVIDYVKERHRATKHMAKALNNVAIETEGKRPWKPKKKKK